jgi:hypothetical protein
MSNQGNRDQEGNLGQPGRDSDKPAGTSGRQGNTGTESWQQNDTNRPASRPRRQDDDDEDSGLGNRTGLR